MSKSRRRLSQDPTQPAKSAGAPKIRKIPMSGLGRLAGGPAPYLLLAGIALILYGHSLTYGLGNLDEDVMLAQKADLLSRITNLPRVALMDPMFNSGGADAYRPLQNISFLLDSQLPLPLAAGHRLVNLLLHALTCCAIFHLLTLFLTDRLTATVLSMIYVVHPLFTPAVVWLPSRGDLLIAILITLAMISLIRFVEIPGLRGLLLHLLWFALAAFSKETALVFPGLAFLYIASVARKRLPLSQYISLLAGYLTVIAAYFAARSAALTGSSSDNQFGVGVLLDNLAVLPEILSKFFIPIRLSLMSTFSPWITLSGCLALLALIAVAVVVYRRKAGDPALGMLGISWVLLFAVPAMMYRYVLVGASYDYLEHRAYLPLIGLMLIAVSLLPKDWNLDRIQSWPLWIGVVAILLSLQSLRYTGTFKDTLSFYTAAIESNGNNALAYSNRGKARLMAGDVEGAIADFGAAIRHAPEYATAYFGRGTSYGMTGRYQESLADLNTGLRLRSDYPDGYFNRALTHLILKDYPAATRDLDAVIRLRPGDRNAYLQRGLARMQLKQLEGACADWRVASDLGDKTAYKSLQLHCR